MSPKVDALLKQAGSLSKADLLVLARELLGMAEGAQPSVTYSWLSARGSVRAGNHDAQDRVSRDRRDADVSREGAA